MTAPRSFPDHLDPDGDGCGECYLEGWGAGYADAEARLSPRLEALSLLADRLYVIAFNSPEDVQRIYQRRMDEHFDAEYERLLRGET